MARTDARIATFDAWQARGDATGPKSAPGPPWRHGRMMLVRHQARKPYPAPPIGWDGAGRLQIERAARPGGRPAHRAYSPPSPSDTAAPLPGGQAGARPAGHAARSHHSAGCATNAQRPAARAPPVGGGALWENRRRPPLQRGWSGARRNRCLAAGAMLRGSLTSMSRSLSACPASTPPAAGAGPSAR